MKPSTILNEKIAEIRKKIAEIRNDILWLSSDINYLKKVHAELEIRLKGLEKRIDEIGDDHDDEIGDDHEY